MTQNYKQMMIDVFEGRDPGGVIWQPRIDFWYEVNKKRGTLPLHLKDYTLIDLYDYCHASVRYFNFPLRLNNPDVVITEQWEDEKSLRRNWETPVGRLTEVVHYDDYMLSRYNFEYLLKTAEDFKIIEWVLQHEEWSFDAEAYAQNEARVGNRGLTQFFSRRTPLQSLFIETMGFENTILFMTDYPKVVEEYLEIQTEADNAMYRLICDNHVPIFNLGDNIDHHMDPPPIWRKYLQPNYERRTAQLHAAGVHTSIHIDGAMKRLLQDIQNCLIECIEACTPLPQGDVTLDEIKTALGDKILMDGIPAIFFLPGNPIEELRACTDECIRLFYPRLILGISDELPPDSDIERVRMVGEWVQE
jgi:hypothetical protein